MNSRVEASKCELEDQFLLRLPPEDAKFVHRVLRKKPKKIKKYLALTLESNMRYGSVRVNKKVLSAKLFDLPTVMESNKTVDNVQLFKTADVCQMLLCREREFPRLEDDKENRMDKVSVKKAYQYPHGIAPPLKNVRKYRFRKTLHNKDDLEEAADIEKEVMLLLRMDNEAASTRFEFIHDEKPIVSSIAQNEIISELSIFGETLSDIDSEKESSSTTSEKNDIMDFTH